MKPLVATAKHWRKCVGSLNHQPAFILGNGPTLPDDLTPLDPFFTVGVNRIWWTGYDPTVVMWTDTEIERDVSTERDEGTGLGNPLGSITYSESQAIVFIRDEICYDKERANDLAPFGNSHTPCHEPLMEPSRISATGNMGTAAAFWAMGLGCRPIYILGMSGTYGAEEDGQELTNFYGQNTAHNHASYIRMNRALVELLAWEHVYPIENQEALNELADLWKPVARGREWFSDRFRTCFHSGQLAHAPG